VPVPIVDLLHPVDVDEGDDESLISASGTIHFVLEHQHPDLAPVRAGEIVEMRGMEFGLQAGTCASGRGSIVGCSLSIGRGVRTELLELLRQRCTRDGVRFVPGLGFRISPTGDLVAPRRGDVAGVCRRAPGIGRSGSCDVAGQASARPRFPSVPSSVVRDIRITTMDGVLEVGQALILIGGRLVARCIGVIVLGCRLVGVGRCLVCVGSGLVRGGRRTLDRLLGLALRS
jgi:hypothetical protein